MEKNHFRQGKIRSGKSENGKILVIKVGKPDFFFLEFDIDVQKASAEDQWFGKEHKGRTEKEETQKLWS